MNEEDEEKIISLKKIQHKMLEYAADGKYHVVIKLTEKYRDTLPEKWFLMKGNRRKLTLVFKGQGIKCHFNKLKKDKEGNTLPQTAAVRLSWYPKHTELKGKFKKKLLYYMPQKQKYFNSLRIKKNKDSVNTRNILKYSRNSLPLEDVEELNKNKNKRNDLSNEDDNKERRTKKRRSTTMSPPKSRKTHNTSTSTSPSSISSTPTRQRRSTSVKPRKSTSPHTEKKRTKTSSSNNNSASTKKRSSTSTSSTTREKGSHHHGTQKKKPVHHTIKVNGERKPKKNDSTINLDENKIEFLNEDGEDANNIDNIKTLDDSAPKKQSSDIKKLNIKTLDEVKKPERKDSGRGSRRGKKDGITSKTEAKLLSIYMSKQIESPRNTLEDSPKTPLNYPYLIKQCEGAYKKDLKFFSIHIDLPLIAHNVTVTKLDRSDTEEIRKTKNKEGSTYNSCQILLTTLASVVGEKNSIDIIQNKYKEIVKQENISGGLLELFKLLGTDSIVVSVLKFCSTTLFTPILSSLKTKLSDKAPFNSDKSGSWNVNINVHPKNKNNFTVFHTRKESSGSTKSNFDFTWITQFSVDLSSENSGHPISSLVCTLNSVNVDRTESGLKRRKITKTIEKAFPKK